jgi:uncharacterized membrane protein
MPAGFMAGLFVVLAVVVALVEFGALTFAYSRLGIDRQWASVLLFATVIGAWANVPVARFPGQPELTDTIVSYLGLHYRVPQMVRGGETVLAVNVGGAVVPAALAAYLVVHAGLGARALLAVFIVAVIVNRFARPLQGVGVVVPTLVPPILAVIVAELIGGPSVAALAYVAGTLGTLVGADLVNLPQVRRWGAPLVSIGGAGTFDGIFVTGVIAVLLAAH